ncbi:MAG: Mg2+/Co2+ transporter [Bacteroidetes bacterium GWF2_49_14]|nr:MAG: Mg2+/Co2+ transporter [Bacteroidetes bacterium GWF2_49_14]HBB92747.1 Mg2+/Co2+ transporter [Bacteroidales bacterium]
MLKFLQDLKSKEHKPGYGGLEIFKYIGPGLLVTVGFIDPGNWASNLAAGADFGYKLLWMVTLSTVMLIILQHNVAHLGIATGLCLSEAASMHLKPFWSRSILGTGMLASVSTSLAEILGGAIALNMLFHIPIKAGALLVLAFVIIMLITNSYRLIEKWIIAFVSIIGLSFIYELSLVNIDWGEAARCWITPSFPHGSMIIIMSVLGAVVMPHNLFLHSEIIQSRQWNLKDDKVIKKQLDFELFDTLFSMIIGWGINSAMILLAATTFFRTQIPITELQQAQETLKPLLGSQASVIFAIALLFAGVASTITSGMAAGTIFAGLYKEPYDIKDNHTRTGVIVSLIVATIIIFLISNPFNGLIISQMMLSIQLPITIFLQVYLTSSEKVMGKYKNRALTKFTLYLVGAIVTSLNIMLLVSILF